MLRSLYSGLLALAAVIAVSAKAQAQQPKTEFEARGSQKIPIFHHGVYNRHNCSTAPRPEIYRMQAGNGTLTKMNYNTTIDKGICKGRSIKTVVVFYTANRGFRGTDSVQIGYRFPAGEDIAFNKGGLRRIKVKVK